MNNLLRTAFGLTAVLGLAACSMAPSYERPQSPVAPQMAQLESDSAAAEAAAAVGWREFYREPKLQQLVEQALHNNRDLRLAALNVEQVQAQYRIARAELLPNLALTGSGVRQQVPESVSQTGAEYTTTQYSVGLGVAAWELDLFGRVNSLRQSALQQYFATVEGRRSVQLSLVAQVGQSYLAWAANRTLLDIAANTLERQEAAYQMVQRRHESGLASDLDVSQAATAVHSSRVDIARYRRQLQQSFTALQLLVGAPLTEQQLGSGLALEGEPTAEIPAALSSQVLLQRPDVQQAEFALQAANANIGAARAAFFPRLALTASAGSASSELNGLFESGTAAWSFSPQIGLPIFAWGANKAALNVAHLQQQASVVRYEQTVENAFKETWDSLQALQTLSAQLSAQQDLVQASARSLELAKVRFERGVDSFLEVLVSERNYNSAQQALITARLAQLHNRIELYKALGGGLDTTTQNLAAITP